MKNIVILISGGGSNMAAIVRAARRDGWNERLGARVAAVISNRADAGGLTLARERGIATVVVDHKAFGSREAFDNALKAEIDAFEPTLVVLAGFMRILTPAFVAHFEGRLLNIHPSLLPAFEMRDEGGREDAHEARQHHQRRLESPDRRRQCDIEAFARGKGLVIDHRRGQTPLAGEGQPAGIGPVADHGRHLGAQAV